MTNFDQVVGTATAEGPHQDGARLWGSTGDDLLSHCAGVGVTPKPASNTEGTLKISREDTTGNKTIPAGRMFKISFSARCF